MLPQATVQLNNENCTSSNLKLKPNIIQNFVAHFIIQLCTLTQKYKDTRTYKHGSPHKEPERFREMESENSVSRKLSPSHLYQKIFALCWHTLRLSQQTQALTIDIFICTIIIIYLVWWAKEGLGAHCPHHLADTLFSSLKIICDWSRFMLPWWRCLKKGNSTYIIKRERKNIYI